MAYTKEFRTRYLELLRAQNGNVKATLALPECQGLSRTTVYRWIEEDPDFAAQVQDIREGWIDNIESALYKQGLEGNVTAQIFMLKTLGKRRGWVEQKEVVFEEKKGLSWFAKDDE